MTFGWRLRPPMTPKRHWENGQADYGAYEPACPTESFKSAEAFAEACFALKEPFLRKLRRLHRSDVAEQAEDCFQAVVARAACKVAEGCSPFGPHSSFIGGLRRAMDRKLMDVSRRIKTAGGIHEQLPDADPDDFRGDLKDRDVPEHPQFVDHSPAEIATRESNLLHLRTRLTLYLRSEGPSFCRRQKEIAAEWLAMMERGSFPCTPREFSEAMEEGQPVPSEGAVRSAFEAVMAKLAHHLRSTWTPEDGWPRTAVMGRGKYRQEIKREKRLRKTASAVGRSIQE
jgi:hypothetical protein